LKSIAARFNSFPPRTTITRARLNSHRAAPYNNSSHVFIYDNKMRAVRLWKREWHKVYDGVRILERVHGRRDVERSPAPGWTYRRRNRKEKKWNIDFWIPLVVC
jgi:hypothetical protein